MNQFIHKDRLARVDRSFKIPTEMDNRIILCRECGDSLVQVRDWTVANSGDGKHLQSSLPDDDDETWCDLCDLHEGDGHRGWIIVPCTLEERKRWMEEDECHPSRSFP